MTRYDDLSRTDEYPCATVAGEVHDTNAALYTSVCANVGIMGSVSVPGYRQELFARPMAPEAISLGMVVLISTSEIHVVSRRRRKKK